MGMTMGVIVDRILKYHADGLLNPHIRKPFAWAVLETWKWVDEHEKPREVIDRSEE